MRRTSTTCAAHDEAGAHQTLSPGLCAVAHMEDVLRNTVRKALKVKLQVTRPLRCPNLLAKAERRPLCARGDNRVGVPAHNSGTFGLVSPHTHQYQDLVDLVTQSSSSTGAGLERQQASSSYQIVADVLEMLYSSVSVLIDQTSSNCCSGEKMDWFPALVNSQIRRVRS